MANLMIDAEKCNKCGMCTEACPGYLIRIAGEEALPSWVKGAEYACLTCGHCVAICPTGALELSSIPVASCVAINRELQPAPEQLEHFLKSRRSVRAYKEEPVEKEKLLKLIDIARYAPSGHNAQPVHWLIIEEREKVKQLAQLSIDWLRGLINTNPDLAGMLQAEVLARTWDYGIDIITRGAPHLIFAHAQKDSVPMGDCTIALTYLELAAHSMGLGACWAGFIQAAALYSPAVAEVVQLPEDHVSFGVMMIGYPKYKYTRIPVRNEARVIWR